MFQLQQKLYKIVFFLLFAPDMFFLYVVLWFVCSVAYALLDKKDN